MRFTAILLRRSTPKWFKSGRTAGLNCFDVKHADLAVSRHFTRTMGQMYGLDTGVEDMKLFLGTKEAKYRKLGSQKVKQLSGLYQEKIANIVSENEKLCKMKVEISGVKVPKTLCEIQVFWVCQGDEMDEVIEKNLEEVSSDLRRALTSQCFGTNVPPLRFVPDRSLLIKKEMDQLFEMADYGVQYRTLSQAAATLGSKSDTGKPKDIDKIPAWRLKQ
ncbi:unnamed protein product [Bursaphelenchus okinawaensis]|uniref:Uncharacterized protein n=1 Tax=Bursaphelenchus okinawaensis TaxID=465554 RepID=A0A811LPD8_9BILA|nr:unnamed protein product [Bursaphelenchus okinawaensis]CAG9125329.1 unnamed protein product [Bursaphelenchus okinawaensis]